MNPQDTYWLRNPATKQDTKSEPSSDVDGDDIAKTTSPPSLESAIGWLICLSGPDKGTRIPVQAQESVIGRGIQSCVILRDTDVAEYHMTIRMVSTDLYFSVAKGCTVQFNGHETTEGKCREGDQLQIGESIWVYDAPDAADWFFRKIAGSISTMMGVDALEAFSFRTLLSDAFHKRTHEEIERHVMVGTPATTPPLSEIPTFWPKPWLFYRALVFFFGSFAMLAATMLIFSNPKLIPALTILGAVGVPLAVTVLFFELNVPQNISVYQTMRALVLGGVISLAITHLGMMIPFPTWLGAASAGPVEEVAKLIALVLVAKGSRYPWTLNGLLFGGAVGAGFGIFETAGYAMEAGAKAGTLGLLINTFVRSILSPGMHVAWTALVGAALWRVRQGHAFRWSMMADFRFIRVLILATAAHMIWNSPFQLPFYGNSLIVTLTLWFALLSLVQAGLNEIREAKRASYASALPAPLT